MKMSTLPIFLFLLIGPWYVKLQALQIEALPTDCGHPSLDCVPYFQCNDGKIKDDGQGLIDLRVRPTASCSNPEYPDVPAECCLKPDHDPIPESVENCPRYEDCVPSSLCSADGNVITDGADLLDIRTGSKLQTCYLPSGDVFLGVCCKYPVADKCGVRNEVVDDSGLKTRIQSHQNNEADFGEFPWQAIILQNNSFICVATLISPRHVLTAAHCVYDLPGGDVKIRFGEWQLNNFEEPLPCEDKNVHAIYIHPDFNPNNVHNDIAVMELVAPIKFKYHINTACLPESGQQMFDPQTSCVATGWGKDSFNGTFQTIMKLVKLPYINKTTCQSLLRKTRLGKYFKLDSSFMCAGGEENKDACYGDGGGPLVCQNQETGQYVIAGVTSWGIGCGKEDVPGVYADVQFLNDWIHKIIM